MREIRFWLAVLFWSALLIFFLYLITQVAQGKALQ